MSDRPNLLVEGAVEKLVQIGSVYGDVLIQPPPPVKPQHFRAPHGDFVGRQREIDVLTTALQSSSVGAPLACIRGMGGVGKTELAYVVAHKVRQRFPDGQLLIRLPASSNPPTERDVLRQIVDLLYQAIRSFDPVGSLTTISAVAAPAHLDDLCARYRSLLAGKRILVLADNVTKTVQVSPLLPPTGCALLVTTRDRFELPGMLTLDLSVLASSETEELITKIYPAIESHKSRLASLCGNLPLAARISASLLAADDTIFASAYVELLEKERLRYLRTPDADPDDPAWSVEASLNLSYRALEPNTQQIYSRLGTFPGDFDLQAVQAVVDVRDRVAVADLVSAFRRRSLVEFNKSTDRYSLHELLREFALSRLQDRDRTVKRHAWYFVQVAEYCNQISSKGPGQLVRAIELAEKERLSIEGAWKWAREQAGDVDADKLACFFALLLLETSSLATIFCKDDETKRSLLTAGAAAASRLKRPDAHGVLLGELADTIADKTERIAAYEEALRVLQTCTLDEANSQIVSAPHRRAVEVLYKLANCTADAPSMSLAYLERAQVIAIQHSDNDAERRLLEKIAKAHHDLGELASASSDIERALAIAQQLGDLPNVDHLKWTLAFLLEERGDLEGALKLMRASPDHVVRQTESNGSTYEEHLQRIRRRFHEKRKAGFEKVGGDLDSFPGMPVLTFNVKSRLKAAIADADLRVRRDASALPIADKEAERYQVFVDGAPVGRFTVRVDGGKIIRNFYCHLPADNTFPDGAIGEGSFGTGNVPLLDFVRRCVEQVQVILYRLLRRLLRPRLAPSSSKDPLIMPRAFPSKWRVSMLGTYVRERRDKNARPKVRAERCQFPGCGSEFALPLVRSKLIVVKEQPIDIWILDVGGYCKQCDKYLCPKHLRLNKVLDEGDDGTNGTDPKTTIELYRTQICCARHGTEVIPGDLFQVGVEKRRAELRSKHPLSGDEANELLMIERFEELAKMIAAVSNEERAAEKAGGDREPKERGPLP